MKLLKNYLFLIVIKRKEKIMNAAGTVFKGALWIGVSMTLGVKGGEVADEFLNGANKNGIKKLRKSLEELVRDIHDRPSNPYKNRYLC